MLYSDSSPKRQSLTSLAYCQKIIKKLSMKKNYGIIISRNQEQNPKNHNPLKANFCWSRGWRWGCVSARALCFVFLKFCVPLSHSKSAHPAKLTVQSQNRLSFKMGLFTTSLVAIEILLAFSTSGQDSGFDNNEMQCLKTLPPREGSLIDQVRNMGVKPLKK